MLDKILIELVQWRQSRSGIVNPPMAVFSADHVGNVISLFGLYEERELTCLAAHVFPGLQHGECLDIGANIGNHSRYFAKAFNHVHCFEVNPDVLAILRFNTSKFDNISIHPLAASSENGSLNFEIQRHGNVGASSVVNTGEVLVNPMTVDAVAIDSVRQKLNICDVSFVKLDIEGHELEALKGMTEILADSSPVIAFECNDRPYGMQMRNFLEENQYTYFYEMSFKHRLSRNRLIRNLKRLCNALHLASFDLSFQLKSLPPAFVPVSSLIVAAKNSLLK
ncbi:FkbM family methyltransferase [Luminiphilus sp.]|nr:FkbM family methyltransferase [Luminiphilus sp.]